MVSVILPFWDAPYRIVAQGNL